MKLDFFSKLIYFILLYFLLSNSFGFLKLFIEDFLNLMIFMFKVKLKPVFFEFYFRNYHFKNHLSFFIMNSLKFILLSKQMPMYFFYRKDHLDD
jgi:hypothetical protein